MNGKDSVNPVLRSVSSRTVLRTVDYGVVPIDWNSFMVTNDGKDGNFFTVDMDHPGHESNVRQCLVAIIFPNIVRRQIARHHPV